jgi:hypothetical protein
MRRFAPVEMHNEMDMRLLCLVRRDAETGLQAMFPDARRRPKNQKKHSLVEDQSTK